MWNVSCVFKFEFLCTYGLHKVRIYGSPSKSKVPNSFVHSYSEMMPYTKHHSRSEGWPCWSPLMPLWCSTKLGRILIPKYSSLGKSKIKYAPSFWKAAIQSFLESNAIGNLFEISLLHIKQHNNGMNLCCHKISNEKMRTGRSRGGECPGVLSCTWRLGLFSVTAWRDLRFLCPPCLLLGPIIYFVFSEEETQKGWEISWNRNQWGFFHPQTF